MIIKGIRKKDFNTKEWNECWENLQYLGYLEAGVSNFNMRLFHGGRVSFQKDADLNSDQIVLYVGQGGLRNRKANIEQKELFKKHVTPTIAANLKKISPKFNGKVSLHYRGGNLDFFDLEATN